MLAQFLKFGVVGTIGFVVDGSILSLLYVMTDWGPIWPRAVSFPIALFVTWYLNRKWTFSDRQSAGKTAEYFRYAIVQSAGVAANLGIYAAAIQWGPWFMAAYPILALAFASVVALIVNYTGAKLWVFRRAA